MMYCRSCLDVIRRTESKPRREEAIVHQGTAEAVCRSYKEGCDICQRLWAQVANHPDRPFGDERWYRLSTIYVIDRTRDKVETERGRDTTDPYTENLSWSGLGYKLKFSWQGLGQSWSGRPPPVEFYLLAAGSKILSNPNPLLNG